MEEPKILIDVLDEPNRDRAGWVKRIPPWLVLTLVPIPVGVAVFFRQPPSLGTATDIALFILAALLCTLGAVSLMLARCNERLRRMEQSSQTMAVQILAVQDMQARLGQAVQKSSQEISARTAQEQGQQQVVQDGVARLTGGLQAVASNLIVLRDVLQAHQGATDATLATLTGGQGQLATEVRQLHASIETIAETTRQVSTAVIALTAGHGQMTHEVRQLQELTRSAAGGISEVAREQTAAHGVLQDRAQRLVAATELVQRGQQALQTQIETVAETARQTIAVMSAVAVEQTAGREAVRRIIGQAANAAIAALTAGHGRLAGTEPPPEISAPTTADSGLPDTASSDPVGKASGPVKLAAAQAVIHGEQMRYEVGPDRDNLGCWANPSDWAQWELEIPQPGRFSLAAEIAALAAGRFQVVIGDEGLAGTAPTTGDYGRFQTVELGAVELAAGKTRLAVRPIPEGWQPMNLRSLDLTPVA